MNNGDRGRVVAVDGERTRLALELNGRRVWLDRKFLLSATQRGDPTLVHGYAITGHVAQGLTVRRTFVLMGQGVSREWGYVALSRGSESNRLYVPAREADPREEFAPGDPHRRSALDRLVAALDSSVGDTLAVDHGHPARSRAEGRIGVDAHRAAYEEAVARRRALETSRLRWLPHGRARLAHARQQEAAALERLRRVECLAAEELHAARPFVSQRELDARTQRVVEIRRSHGRDMGIER